MMVRRRTGGWTIDFGAWRSSHGCHLCRLLSFLPLMIFVGTKLQGVGGIFGFLLFFSVRVERRKWILNFPSETGKFLDFLSLPAAFCYLSGLRELRLRLFQV